MRYLIEQDIRALENEINKLERMLDSSKSDLRYEERRGCGFERDITFYEREISDIERDIDRCKDKIRDLERQI